MRVNDHKAIVSKLIDNVSGTLTIFYNRYIQSKTRILERTNDGIKFGLPVELLETLAATAVPYMLPGMKIRTEGFLIVFVASVLHRSSFPPAARSSAGKAYSRIIHFIKIVHSVSSQIEA